MPWALHANDVARLSKQWGCNSSDNFARQLLPSVLAKHELCSPANNTGTPKRCYIPISGFPCYAVVTGKTGGVYVGINLEFPGSPIGATLHAEQFATLVAAGVGRSRSMSWDETGLTSLAQRGNGAPCGHCRQWLTEFVDAPSLTILGTESESTRYNMSTIFANAFGPSALNNTCPLLSQRPECTRPGTRPTQLRGARARQQDALEQAAINAATTAYAPYTNRRSGVALQLASGRIVAEGQWRSRSV